MVQDVELGSIGSPKLSELSLSTSENHDECSQMLFLKAVKNCNRKEVENQLENAYNALHPQVDFNDPELIPIRPSSSKDRAESAWKIINFTDHNGNTALHIAIQLEVESLQEIDKLRMIETLIKYDNYYNSEIDNENQTPLDSDFRVCPQIISDNRCIYKINNKNQTFLDLAFDVADTQTISLLLIKYNDIDWYLDQKSVLEEGKTCRDVLQERWPAVYLFYELYHKKMEQFFKLAEKDEHNLLIKDNGCIYTFLQCACEKGLTEVVEYYLKNLNVDVNRNTLFMKESPLKIATIKGYYRIIELFYKYAKEPQFYEPKLLFTLVDRILRSSVSECVRVDYYKCVEKLLLLNDRNPLFDINMDKYITYGTTLQYSLWYSDNHLVSKLLHHGAWFGTKDPFEDHTLKSLKPWQLRKHFDDCMKKSSTALERDINNSIQFDYRSLAPLRLLKQDGRFIKNRYNVVGLESDLLLEMGHRPQFRELLKHPLITSFLHLKWIVIQKFFYINLILHFVFCCLLTLYSSIYITWSNDTLWENIFKTLNDTTSSPNIIEPSESGFIGTILHTATVIFWILFCLQKVLLQFFYSSSSSYFKSPKNLIEIFNAVIGAHLLFQMHVYREPAALLSLTIWGEAVLLLGRHPKLSIYVTMFKTVIVNFLKFFALYGILIFAFALSFCLLFPEKDGKKNEVFENPLMAFFKIFIMMTGEYEASSLPFQLFPFISRVVFALLIFLLAIVLLSLLNGLAVGDLAKIRSDAEMSEIICRIETFLYFEKMRLFQSLLNMFNSWSQLERLSGWIRATARTLKLWFTVTLFPDILYTGRAYIYPNVNNVIHFHDEHSTPEQRTRSFGWRMNSDIIEAAQLVIEKGKSEGGAISSYDLAKRCSKQLKRLNRIKKFSERISEKISTQFTPKLEIIEGNVKTLMECHQRLHVDEQISERNEKLLTQFELKFEFIERKEKTLIECHERLHMLEHISEFNEKMLTTLYNILQEK